MSYGICIGKMPTLNANIVAYDERGSFGVAFMSAFGYSSNMDSIKKEINLARKDIYFRGRYYGTGNGKLYETIVSKSNASDYAHFVAYKKDSCQSADNGTSDEYIEGYIFFESENVLPKEIDYEDADSVPQELVDSFYDKLYKLSPLPVIKEWSNYLLAAMAANRMFYPLTVITSDDSANFNAYAFRVSVRNLREFISRGLQQREIFIGDASRETSETMHDIEGLDTYLNEFQDVLARRIQESFVPRFTPNEQEYSQILNDVAEYDAYMGRLNPFDAQKDVIQATVNALNDKKSTFIIGETGCGRLL